MSAHPMPQASQPLPSGVARLTHLGVIEAAGADAAKFMHGQLTQDFILLGHNQARLAAYCSPKGRVLATVLGIKCPDASLLLVCERDIVAATLERLRKFVLRAKVSLSDASDRFAVWGVAGQAIPHAALPAATEEAAHSAWHTTVIDSAAWVSLYPADGTPRQMCVAPSTSPAPAGAPLALDTWRWSDVRSGVASVGAALSEALVPQMLNYESVGAINFKKGCYPGQEVVARSQFRGTLKRRTFLAHTEATAAAADEVFCAHEEQAVGVVVQAAPAPTGGTAVLMSLQIAALESGPVHLRTPDGPLLQLQTLPYPLLADV